MKCFHFQTSQFLVQFGYVDISNPTETAGAGDQNSPVFRKAIRTLQWFGGIPVTGIIDRKTLELISTSRCGMKDPPPPSSRWIGEFKKQGTYWKKRVGLFHLQRNITIQEKTKAEHLTLLTESRPRSKVHSET